MDDDFMTTECLIKILQIWSTSSFEKQANELTGFCDFLEF